MRCPTCNKRLNTTQGMRQHHAKVHGESLLNRTCRDCGSDFYDPKAQRTFCDDCNPNGGRNNGNWRGATETTTCRRCGDQFEYYPSDKTGVYCSSCVEESDEFLGDPYVKEAERTTKSCEQCGVKMNVLQSEVDRGRGKFCCRDCLATWLSENVIGKDHHQWAGGVLNYGQGWWSVRRRALERDGHQCRSCGKSAEEIGREPDVHHIVPVRNFDIPADAHGLDNVICLCRSCHRQVEDGTMSLPQSSPKR